MEFYESEHSNTKQGKSLSLSLTDIMLKIMYNFLLLGIGKSFSKNYLSKVFK